MEKNLIKSELDYEKEFLNTVSQRKDGKKYVMGIDGGGYNNASFAICVIEHGGAIVYLNTTKNKKDFDTEIKKLSEYYRISEDSILKETP